MRFMFVGEAEPVQAAGRARTSLSASSWPSGPCEHYLSGKRAFMHCARARR